MAAISTVGVRELRQNLSVYLDRVKDGETLTVTEFRQVVAILRPPAQRDDDVIGRLVAEGRATAPSRIPADLPKPLNVRLKTPLRAILDELREDTI
jgi:antitoxin (DNA-binding transcriptional repressor) of toxin-antitoxin stability system